MVHVIKAWYKPMIGVLRQEPDQSFTADLWIRDKFGLKNEVHKVEPDPDQLKRIEQDPGKEILLKDDEIRYLWEVLHEQI